MPRRLFVFLLVLFLTGGAGIIFTWRLSPTVESPPQIATSTVPLSVVVEEKPIAASSTVFVPNAAVLRVIDGDTFVVQLDNEDGEFTIRLLGIDTPETVDPRKTVECFGKEASQKTTDLLAGKRVYLEADVQADERDRYGRLLRNVFLVDGTDVNALLVQEGYAHAYLSFPLKKERKKQLQELQESAKTSMVGLWGEHCR